MTSLLEKEEKTSPMMMQWHSCKSKSEGALLLFRLGDFYEAFYEDAVVLSKELDLTLTKRQDIPMAGLPFHTSEGYIDKLVGKGYRVAVAEQIEDPAQTKGLVKRDIVRIVTPGTLVTSSLLSDKTNNFIACLSLVNHISGLAVLDLTTAELKVFEFENFSSLSDELVRLQPKELIVSNKCHTIHREGLETLRSRFPFSLLPKEDWHFEHEQTYRFLTDHFQVHSLDGLGLQGMTCAINAAGCLLAYVKRELNLSISHVQTLQKEHSNRYMCLDGTTLKHLEILESAHEDQGDCTLLHLLDKTLTPMGGRLLKYWIAHPLLDVDAVAQRQDAVAYLLKKNSLRELSTPLGEIRDLERLIMRVETGYATPKDLLSLCLSLEQLPLISPLLQGDCGSLLQEQIDGLCDVSGIAGKIRSAITDNPPFRLSDGNVIKEGYSSELDELRELSRDNYGWIARYQTSLREETQIKTLKVAYTKAFGYYIEISRGQAERAPSSFQRKQTLLNTERFTTPQLKEYEYKLLSAEEKIAGIESDLFNTLRKEVASYGSSIRGIASAVAKIDCLASFAKTALASDYVRPVVDNGVVFQIEEGRHPILESILPANAFIPNDLLLDDASNRLMIITGPNMAGKSTFIRQAALIAVLAQIGSFVPAKSVRLGVLDKIFTRIGAGDNLSKGQSTFMVEMTETAGILHGVTDRSLVILDEIGRGTGTYDGISIARAVAEYLLTTEGKKAKTLFATHYCELIELEEKIPGAINYHVSVHESAHDIVFLRKIIKGGTDKSYGIHVGRLAGLPRSVITRAQELLKILTKGTVPKKAPRQEQLSFFSAPVEENPLIEEIKRTDVNRLTPMEALQKIAEWKKRADSSSPF